MVKQREKAALAKDTVALEDFIMHLREKGKHLVNQVNDLKATIAADEKRETQRRQTRADLERQIDEQGLSDIEIKRLTNDRFQLEEQHRLQTAKLTETMQAAGEAEVQLSRVQATAEKLIDEYSAKATRLGLIPRPPDGYEELTEAFQQDINGSATVASEIVPLDALARIRPAVMRMKGEVVNARQSDLKAADEVETELVNVNERLNDLAELRDRAQERLDGINEHLNSTKEAIAAETAQSNAEMEKTDRKVTELRDQLSGSLLNADQRLQALEQECVDPLVSQLTHAGMFD